MDLRVASEDLLTFPWVGSTASIGHFWAAADAAGRSLTCPLPAQRVHRGSRVKGGRRPSQRDALAPLTREGCTRRRRGSDLHARMGTQSRCSEIDPRKRHKRWEWALARPLAVDENRCARRPLTSIRLGPFRPYKRLTLEPHPRVSPGCRYEREYQSLSSCLGAPWATRAAVDPSRKEDWTCKFCTSGALLSMSVRM